MISIALNSRNALFVLLLAMSTLSCTYGATEVVVTVNTDAPPERMLTLRASVSRPNGTMGMVQTWTRGAGGIQLPASFAVTPGPGQSTSEIVTLVLEADLAAVDSSRPATTFRRIARFAFAPRQPSTLPIFLATSCGDPATGCTTTGMPCTSSLRCEEQGMTCGDNGDCVSQQAVVTPLMPNQPEETSVRVDAARDVPPVLDAPSTLLTVAPLYPTHGSNWNDYVTTGSDTACTGLPAGYTTCEHGGEQRKVVISGINNCTGLSLTDHLGAFDWRCTVVNGTATFTSALKSTAGLVDLVDSAAWKSNFVTLAGTVAGASAPASWWTNPVVPLPDNSSGPALISLDSAQFGAGAVFTLATSRATYGYNLNGDKMSLVVFRGQTLSWASGPPPANYAYPTGEVGAPGFSTLVLVSQQSFNWIEGTFDGANATGPVSVAIAAENAVNFLRLHQVTARRIDRHGVCLVGNNGSYADQVTVSDCGWHCFWLIDSSHNRIDNLSVANSATGEGLELSMGAQNGNVVSNVISVNNSVHGVALDSNSTGNRFSNIIAVNNTADGFNTNASTGNRIDGIFLSNNGGDGLHLQTGSSNVIETLVATSNTGVGLRIDNSNQNVVNAATITNNSGTAGIIVGNAQSNVLNQIVTANQADGMDVNGGSSGNTFSQFVATNCGAGVRFTENANGNRFEGTLVVGSNGTDCAVMAGGELAVIDGTCNNNGLNNTANYSPGSLTNADLLNNRDLSASFVGKVSSNVAANTSDNNGTAAYPSTSGTFDWGHFDNPFESWGLDGSGPSTMASLRGRWVTGPGRIWDWRLAASDASLAGRNGDGMTANSPFVSGVTCPRSVYGNLVGQLGTIGLNPYLLNATERLGAGGDDDGLCETGESCVYSPNYGAYQGSGALLPCTFDDGGGNDIVNRVTIVGYSLP